ncbi:alpha/beta hydrolase [Ferruginibacter yonginensis]|uniref:Alpha/beta hydrolase n=1 Tax=Ferruginibacter yonginensis TaxID=1310416 RepID=A0ABV8QRW4_9BACT
MLKLLLGVLLLLAAFLVLFRAPNHWLWLTSVAITNFPYIPMLLSIGIIFWGYRSQQYQMVTMILGVISLVIYALPIVNAYKMNQRLAKNLQAAFPKDVTIAQTPFSFFNMFRKNETVQYTTLQYAAYPDKKLMLDFYANHQNKKAPLVIVIHGGSWQTGDSKQLPELNSYLANRGYNVAAINYRLAPDYKAPAPVEDTKAVIDFFTQHAAQYNIDTNNIILIGRSAGAQIALCTAYVLQLPNIKGVVSYYGPADMVWGAQIKVSKKVLDTETIYNNYFGGQYNEVPQKFVESSATAQATTKAPPTLIIHGAIDPLVSYQHAERLQVVLNKLNIPNYFVALPFATHGCDYSLNGPDGQICTYAVLHFLNAVVINK